MSRGRPRRESVPDPVRFEALIAEYKSEFEGWTEQEKAQKEDEIRSCRPLTVENPDAKRTGNSEDWLAPLLPHEGRYDFTLRKRLLNLGPLAKPLWDALERGMHYKQTRKCWKRFNDRMVEGVPIPKSEYPKILQQIIGEVWDGTPRKRKVKVDDGTNAKVVEEFFRTKGAEGATDDEVQIALPNLDNTRQRRVDLVRKGLVQFSGQWRLASSGVKTKVWIIATGEPAPKAKTYRFVSAQTEAVQAVRDSFMARLALIAQKAAESTLDPKEVVQEGPWLHSYINAVLAGVAIPSIIVEKKLHEMTTALNDLFDDWESDLRRLRRVYEPKSDIVGPEPDDAKWAEIRDCCEWFNIELPTSSRVRVDFTSVQRTYKRKLGGCHPDKFAHLGKEIAAEKEAQFKRLKNAYDALKAWNDRIDFIEFTEAPPGGTNGRDNDPNADRDSPSPIPTASPEAGQAAQGDRP